jgi:glucosamine--fructose-6-phosphate aminotransferase (isomerizing)
MCGIIGYTGEREATAILLEGLRRLEYRGYDSAGVAVLPRDGGSCQRIRRAGKIVNLAEALGEDPPTGHCGIGHTRWATHGPPTRRNAHPQRAGKVSVVHNGIIDNHGELRGELDEPRFDSDTDTEVLAKLIEEAYDALASSGATPDLHAAVRRALHGVRGAWGLCVLHDDHPDEIVVARNHSPLLIGLSGPKYGLDSPGPETFVASDVSAMLQYTRTVVDLEDGDTAHLDRSGIRALMNADGRPVRRPRRTIDWSPQAAEKGGFKHFMLKEIFEQPRVIRDTVAGRVEDETVQLEGLDDLEIDETTRILGLACGTSFHAAMAAKFMIESIARVPVDLDLASEFRIRDPLVGPHHIALPISQSGETADTLAALKLAQSKGARALAICNVVDSSIARQAGRVLYTRAGPEISVASTKAFTTQLTLLTLFATWLARRRGAIDAEREQELLTALDSVPQAIDAVLEDRESVLSVAERHREAHDYLFLGRGLSFPAALEGALKLKEISYIHAEGYAAGEMKHGPIALIDERVPVVVLALHGPGYDKTIANLETVRSRRGHIIAVAVEGDQDVADLSDDVLWIPRVDPIVQPLVASVPLQLLAYYTADLKGTDVDQPRNLAKSVTVE